VTDLVLDPGKSNLRIRTFAEGLFAKLAHDLELRCTQLEGKASRQGDDLSTGKAELDVPLGGIDVAGTLKGEVVDDRGLSPSDRADCLAKMRKDVFQAGPSESVHVEVVLENGSARVKVVPPNGSSVERTMRPTLTDEGGGRVRVKGALDVSLKAIGSGVVKGPMNAFRVKDRVEILFDVTFQPA
jgi:hypothetical protein